MLSIIGDTAAIIGAGTVRVTAVKAADNNFNEATATLDIAIGKATPTVTINEVSYYIYNGKPVTNPTAEQVTVTGADYADVEFLYSTVMSGPYTAQAPKDAGINYYVKARILETENTKAYYSQPKTFSIKEKGISIAGGTAASKKYDGGADAIVTDLIFSGLQNGETLELGRDYLVGSPAYDNANVGTEKTVSGTASLILNEKLKTTISFRVITLSETA